MKFTKTLVASVALAAFAMPMTASAQIGTVGVNDVIGSISSVVGNVGIERSGQYLRVQDMSAVLAGDRIFAENGGSAMVNLNGCNGKFTPCNQFVSGGNMVSLASGNYCADLAAVMPLGSGSSVLSAASSAGGAISGPAIGTALSKNALFAILGLGAGALIINEVISDDDDDNADNGASG